MPKKPRTFSHAGSGMFWRTPTHQPSKCFPRSSKAQDLWFDSGVGEHGEVSLSRNVPGSSTQLVQPALWVPQLKRVGEMEAAESHQKCYPRLLSHLSALLFHLNKTWGPAVWVGFAPAPWFQFLVSILQRVGSFLSSEHYCFSDWNSHPENLSTRAFVLLFAFLIIYVFPLPDAWRHQIAVEVTAWGKATINHFTPLGGNMQLYQEG